MRKILLFLISFSLTFVVGCNNQNEEEQTAPQEPPYTITEDELAEEDQTVLSVNDKEIDGTAYNRVYRMVKNTLYQYGENVEDTDMVKEQTINELITQELIIQDAKEQGIEVEEEKITEQIGDLKEKYGDQFDSALEANGYNEETYKMQLRENFLANKYMEKEFNIKVTEEDITNYYLELTHQSEEELPELAEIENQIEQTLLTEKKQQKQEEINEQINELKENAEIEKLM